MCSIVDDGPSALALCPSVIHVAYISSSWRPPSWLAIYRELRSNDIGRRHLPVPDNAPTVGSRRSRGTQSASTPGPAVALAAHPRPQPLTAARVDFERTVVQCIPMPSIIDRRARYIGLRLTDR